jgi:acylphosphatase
MSRTVKIQISGRVQGVYFRRFTQSKAKDLGVKGSVKNLEDGRVEIIAQAEADILETFIQWCHKGPITSRVDEVELVEMPTYESIFDRFDVV